MNPHATQPAHSWRGRAIGPIRVAFTFVLATFLVTGGGPAHAHARLVGSQPAADSSVTAVPEVLVLEFSEAIEPDFSRIEVVGPDGHRIDDGIPQGPSGQRTKLVVRLNKAAPGTCTVKWNVLSVDAHKSSGTFRFRIVP